MQLQVTIVYGETQWDEFRRFLLDQLTLLMRGVMDPDMVKRKLESQRRDADMRQMCQKRAQQPDR